MNKKVFILGRYISDKFPPAPVKVAQRIFDELTKQKYDVTFIEYFFEGKKYNIFSKIFGKETSVTNIGGTVLRLGILRLAYFLLQSKPDVIHIITFERFPLIAFLLLPLLKYRIFYSTHGVFKYERELNDLKISKTYLFKENLCNIIYYNFSDILLFLSEDSVKIARRYYKLKSDRIRIISNGIDTCFSNTYIKDRRNKNKKNKIIFIGDFNRKEKGLEFLFEVLTNIKLEIELYIIGANYDKNKTYCSNKAISIHLVDKMKENDLAEFYEDKNIFISTSLHDSFGMAPVEAMAAGLVPVVTKETGMSRFIQDGINGFTFKYGEGEVLIKILELILGDNKIQERISREAAKVYEQLSWEKILEMYQQIYNLS